MPKKKCHDVDGAYFGCSFAHILLMVIYFINFRPTPNLLLSLYNQLSFQKCLDLKYMVKRVLNFVKKNNLKKSHIILKKN